MVIRKEGSKWVLRSRKTGKILGKHATRKGALRQERAIWVSKRRRNYSCVVIRRRDGIRQRYHIKVAQPKAVKSIRKEEVIIEPKYDGTRTILRVNGDKHTLINRRGIVKNKTYPEFKKIHKQIKGDAELDGEIVAIDKKKPFGNFEKLATRDRLSDIKKIKERSKQIPLKYIAFDILKKNGKDVSKLPLLERKKILDKTIKQNKLIQEIEYSNKLDTILKKVKKAKGEGVIIKDINAPYQKGQTRTWEKLKLSKDNDVAIIGYTKGAGKRKKYFGALKMAVYTKNGFKNVGNVGTGFNDEDLKELTRRLKKGEKLVARIKYRKIGSKGNYIEPRFQGLREDISQKQTHL